MSESWKGPSAIIGIAGLLVTLGIFAYQAYESGMEKRQRDSMETELRIDEQRKRDSIAKLFDRAEQKRQQKIIIAQRILWIEQHLPAYDDSLLQAEKRLKNFRTRDDYARARLADTTNPPSSTAKSDLYEYLADYTSNLRDSARIQDAIRSLNHVRQKLSDSLKIYYE